MAKHRIFGYCTPWSVKPGDDMRFMVSAEGVTEARAMLVRLLHGDENAAGPGFVEQEIPGAVPDLLHVRRQFTQKGSYAEVSGMEVHDVADGSFTLAAFVFPTAPGTRRQTMLGRWDIAGSQGWALGINPEGHLEFWVGNGQDVDQVTAEVPLIPRSWYFVAATWDAATRRARLVQLGDYASPDEAEAAWARLGMQFSDFLDSKARVIAPVQSGGQQRYRLRAYGFEDLAEARNLCAALIAEQADCIPVRM